jgi:hypothetical protein
MLTTLALSLGADVPSSSAGNSSFCAAVFSWVTASKTDANPPATPGGYSKWAKEVLPYFEKMASTAPNAKSKEVLNAVVDVYSYLSKDKNPADAFKYFGLNEKKLLNASKTLASSIASCA